MSEWVWNSAASCISPLKELGARFPGCTGELKVLQRSLAQPPPLYVLTPWSQQSICPDFCEPHTELAVSATAFTLSARFFQLIHSWGCPSSCAKGDEGLPLQWRCISKSAHQVMFFWKVWVLMLFIWVKEVTGGCFCGRVFEGHCQCPGCISWLAWGCQVDTGEPRSGVCAAGQAPT